MRVWLAVLPFVAALIRAVPASAASGDAAAFEASLARGAGLEPLPQAADAARLQTRALLAAPLRAADAVRLAFLNNPDLRARLEELGVARARAVQAGLPTNPFVHFALRAPSGGGAARTGREFGVSEEFLELASLPLRRRLASGRYEAARLELGHAVLGLAARVEEAYDAAQAAQARLKARQDQLQALTAAGLLAAGQRAAGDASRLDELRRRAAREESALEVDREQAAATVARERLSLLMGVQDEGDWTLAPAPPLPAVDPPLPELEETALNRRWDLEAARREPALLGRALALSRLRAVGGLSLGYDSEKDLDGKFGQGPAVEWSVPLFDRGQARRASLRARSRAAAARLEALSARVRFEVRAADAELVQARARVEGYDARLLPLRAQIQEESLKRYDFMLAGAYDLLAARREELQDELGRIGAARDYWTARARLKLATGGALPPTAASGGGK